MKKTVLIIFAIIAIFSQTINAHQHDGIKVVLSFKVKSDTQKEFMKFLEKNVPNVRAFEGCSSVKLYFDESNKEMIITENWLSKEHHGRYIQFISKNGVMEGLISYLDGKPSIKYYEILDI